NRKAGRLPRWKINNSPMPSSAIGKLRYNTSAQLSGNGCRSRAEWKPCRFHSFSTPTYSQNTIRKSWMLNGAICRAFVFIVDIFSLQCQVAIFLQLFVNQYFVLIFSCVFLFFTLPLV